MNDTVPASFRTDLKLFGGPRDFDGSPTHNLYDPVNDRYFKLSWQEAAIYKLSKPGMTIKQIADAVNSYTTIRIDPDDVAFYFQQAALLGLLNIGRSSEQVLEKQGKEKSNPLWWALKNYLYFRVPLITPDKFLTKTLPYVRVLWSKTAKIAYAIATIIGLLIVLSRFDEYVHTFSYFFNFQGILAYGTAICTIKVIHEFSHAYTAKNYGIYVPTMGAAFIVMWPVLYTDVTASWRLAQRSQRLAITIAGVSAELIVAGLATLGWAITPPGPLKTVFFILSSVTWISSLFININPAMRFDGYYLLCDLWGIDNLRQRAFAVGRWQIHRWLLNIDMPCPEPDLPPHKIRQLYLYSFFTVTYLFIVYVAIALFVYHAFTKALGIFLFAVEIGVFFIWPVVWEAQMLYKVRDHLSLNKRSITTMAVIAILSIWLILPWPHEERFEAITIPEYRQELWVSEEGLITDIKVKRGQTIETGQPIATIVGQNLQSAVQVIEAEVAGLQSNVDRLASTPESRIRLASEQATLASAKHRLAALKKKQQKLEIKADISGTLYDWDTSLKDGQPVEQKQLLGKIADIQKVLVIAYIPEDLSSILKPGSQVQFRLPSSATRYNGVVKEVSNVSNNILDYPALSSKFGGPLPTTIDKGNQLRLTSTYYQATIVLEGNPPPPFGKIGIIAARGDSYSLLARGVRNLWALLLQESSL